MPRLARQALQLSGALLCAALVACAGARPVAAPRASRVALFPPANLSGASVPMAELRAGLEAALRDEHVALVEPAALEEFLARHRIRNTSGVDREAALAAAAELGADGVLVALVELYQRAGPAKLGVTLRLVTTGAEPAIAWIDGRSRTGDDSPGLFDLGLADYPELQARVLRGLAASFAAWRDGAGPRAPACAPSSRFRPRIAFRAPALERAGRASVAVLPFLNETQRRSAGEVLALEFARQLEASGRFRVIEPGLVRDELLRYRIVMESGVSLDAARVVSALLHADLVLAGTVRDYQDGGDAPGVDFTTVVLESKNDEVVWQSTSHNRGDDGVFFFDAGRVSTAGELGCRMAGGVVELLGAKR